MIRSVFDSIIRYFYHHPKTIEFSSSFVEEIENVLKRAPDGVRLSNLSPIQDFYRCTNGKPLDYKSFGMRNIQDLFLELAAQNKVLLLNKPRIGTCVMSVRLAKWNQKYFLKDVVTSLLKLHGGEIPFTSFRDFYRDRYKREWDCFYFGLTDLDQVCHVLKLNVMVELNSSGDKVMKAIPRDSSLQAALVRDIDDILQRCPWGIAFSDLSCIEVTYQLIHGKPLDYESFGVVENIEDLIQELGDQNKVLILDRTQDEDSYVMSIRLAESQHKDNLKSIVEKLLEIYGGEITFYSFHDCYWDTFQVEWNPSDFGVDGLDRLCDFLKDIVMVEVNSSGEKVIKAVNKDSSPQDSRPTI